jgi:hypothetical protein
MRKNVIQENDQRVAHLRQRLDVREWDFSQVPPAEEHACCYYEYARESDWLMTEVDAPVEQPARADEPGSNRAKLLKSLLIFILPPVRRIIGGRPGKKDRPVGRQKSFDGRPWLAQEPEWRQEFVQNLNHYKDRYHHSYGIIQKKSLDRAISVGIALPFPWRRWVDNHAPGEPDQVKRMLDGDTGLEVLLLTIDWDNFTDADIIERFQHWVKNEGRPKGVGVRSTKGQRTDAWRKKLERLALLRLRHHYTLDELAVLLPEAWASLDKFTDPTEFERERKITRQTLFDLFPFLPADAQPIHWPKFKAAPAG